MKTRRACISVNLRDSVGRAENEYSRRAMSAAIDESPDDSASQIDLIISVLFFIYFFLV
jgi:hypothetical protein